MAVGRTGNRVAYFLVNLMTKNAAPGVQPPPDAPVNGQTLPSRHGEPEPRLPHERDESSDSHPGTADVRIELAARDLEQGKQDTGRTPVVTELARKTLPPAPEPRHGPNGKRGEDRGQSGTSQDS